MKGRSFVVFRRKGCLAWDDAEKTRRVIQMALDAGQKIEITFSVTCRWHAGAKATRKLRRFDVDGTTPIVFFGGWNDFRLRPSEILEIEMQL